VEGGDEAEEAERRPSAGVVEFPGIVKADSASIRNPGNAGEWQAASSIGFASAQRQPGAGRGQGLKILAREDNYIAARYKLPISQTEWLWDCLTPQAALAGISVPAGAVAFARTNTAAETSSGIPVMVRRLSSPSHPRAASGATAPTSTKAALIGDPGSTLAGID